MGRYAKAALCACIAALSFFTHSAFSEEKTDCGDFFGMRDAWFQAAASGNLDVMVDLLQRPGCVTDVNMEKMPGEDQRTALFVAAAGNQLSAVQLILLQISVLPESERDSILNKRDEHGDTPLMAAAHSGDRTIERLLLAAGARKDLRNKIDKEDPGYNGVDAATIAANAAGRRAIPDCTKKTEECEQGGTEPHQRGYIGDAWKLGVEDLPVTSFQPYRPNYVIYRATSHVNRLPTSPTRGETPFQSYESSELKFQFSFKNEIVSPQFFRDVLGASDKLRLWIAFTQQSNWQVANGSISRPFRNTNYEPEAILTYDNRDNDRPYKGEPRSRLSPELVNFGFVHQSNGRSNPESRSWNRLYVQGAWQVSEELSVLPRIWASAATDDNPDIDHYQRADMIARYDAGKWGRLELLARSNLSLGNSKAFFQLDWSTPLHVGAAALHAQITSGYGETLLDYNFRQTTFGLGLSLADW